MNDGFPEINNLALYLLDFERYYFDVNIYG